MTTTPTLDDLDFATLKLLALRCTKCTRDVEFIGHLVCMHDYWMFTMWCATCKDLFLKPFESFKPRDNIAVNLNSHSCTQVKLTIRPFTARPKGSLT